MTLYTHTMDAFTGVTTSTISISTIFFMRLEDTTDEKSLVMTFDWERQWTCGCGAPSERKHDLQSGERCYSGSQKRLDRCWRAYTDSGSTGITKQGGGVG